MNWELLGPTLGSPQKPANPTIALLYAVASLPGAVDRLLWIVRKPFVIRALAFEIELEAQAYLDEERAYAAEWPWETDVLDRMDIDETAQILEIQWVLEYD